MNTPYMNIQTGGEDGEKILAVYLNIPNNTYKATMQWATALGLNPKRLGWSATFGFTLVELFPTTEQLNQIDRSMSAKGYEVTYYA